MLLLFLHEWIKCAPDSINFNSFCIVYFSTRFLHFAHINHLAHLWIRLRMKPSPQDSQMQSTAAKVAALVLEFYTRTSLATLTIEQPSSFASTDRNLCWLLAFYARTAVLQPSPELILRLVLGKFGSSSQIRVGGFSPRWAATINHRANRTRSVRFGSGKESSCQGCTGSEYQLWGTAKTRDNPSRNRRVFKRE